MLQPTQNQKDNHMAKEPKKESGSKLVDNTVPAPAKAPTVKATKKPLTGDKGGLTQVDYI